MNEFISIVKRLSGLDPIVEQDTGSLSCFFCYSFEEDNEGNIIHDEDCLWKKSNNVINNTPVEEDVNE